VRKTDEVKVREVSLLTIGLRLRILPRPWAKESMPESTPPNDRDEGFAPRAPIKPTLDEGPGEEQVHVEAVRRLDEGRTEEASFDGLKISEALLADSGHAAAPDGFVSLKPMILRPFSA